MRWPVWVLAVIGCGSSGGGGIALQDYLTRLQTAECKQAVTCNIYPDTATCNASFPTSDFFGLTMVAAVGRKEVAYDGNAAAMCIGEVATRSCSFQGFRPTPGDPCDKVFVGKVATGGACAFTAECAPGNLCTYAMACDTSKACCAGTCVASGQAAVGASCTQSADCVDTAYCTSTTMKCAAIVETEGGACDDFAACADPMVCNYDFTTNKFSTCYTPAAKDAPCDPAKFFPCADENQYCDTTTKKCTDDVGVGQPCQGSNGAQCVWYDICSQTNFHCVAAARAGEACTVDTNGNSNCLSALTCQAGTCQLPGYTACP